MSKDQEEWPGFADELGRKAIGQVEKWTAAHEAGRISTREYFIAVSTVYDATSGLAPKEISDLIADVHQDIRTNAKRKS